MEPNMSALPAMAPQSTPKTMSSRLMTMKFMQRGVASESNSPTTPRSESEGSTKRRKISHASSARESPSTPLYDQKAVQAALAEEDRKREAAIEKRALELGDARWVLDARPSPSGAGLHPPLNVVRVGFAQIDSRAALDGSEVTTEGQEPPAKNNFRRYNMKKSQKSRPSSSSDNDSSGSEDESDNSSSPGDRDGRGSRGSGLENRKRSVSVASSKRKDERAKALLLAGKRRKKEIKLNQLTSISSSGSSRPGPTKCYTCGQPGHKAADCSRKAAR